MCVISVMFWDNGIKVPPAIVTDCTTNRKREEQTVLERSFVLHVDVRSRKRV